MSENMVENENPDQEKSRLSGLFDIVSVITTAAVIVAIAFIFFFRTVGVSGRSMNPTLNDRDRIILSAYDFKPQQGQIVVTCQPNEYGTDIIENVLVKRIIATEGQTIKIDFYNAVVYVDGEPIDDSYKLDDFYTASAIEDYYELYGDNFTIPEGYVFVMGDNRNNSTDSRSHLVGLIREDYILGKALFRVAPFGQFKIG